MSSAGYNPMRWKCEQLGCFNKVARPKIELFAECFPRRIAMGDMDGYVEIGGKFLILEWKNTGCDLLEGQRLAFDALRRIPDRMFTILCIAGDAHRMTVYSAMHYTNEFSRWQDRDFAWCKLFVKRWADWADNWSRICHASEGT